MVQFPQGCGQCMVGLLHLNPTSLLLIYKLIILAKLDYWCFFSSSASPTHCNILNKLQISCLRTIFGAIRSTPSLAIEIEMACPLLYIRCRWLAGKLLLKSLGSLHSDTSLNYLEVYYYWRYVQKILPILALTTHLLAPIREYIIKSNNLPLFETSFSSLLLLPIMHSNKIFLKFTIEFLKVTQPNFINGLFLDYISKSFTDFIWIFTNGSVTSLLILLLWNSTSPSAIIFLPQHRLIPPNAR